MSTSALELVQEHYAASARGDLPGMLACLADDVAWTEMAGFPYAGTYTGPDEVSARVFGRIGKDWKGFRAVPDHFVSTEDEVVVFGVYSGMNRATGKSMEARFVHHWQIEDGAAVRFEQYTDTRLVTDAMAD